MIQYYKDNLQLYFLFFVWLIFGMYGGYSSFVIIPLSMLLLYKKDMYEELFLGFLFILILSDSLEERLVFAKTFKNIYIVLLALFMLKDSQSFAPFSRLYKIYIPFFVFSLVLIFFNIDQPFFFTGLQKTISYALVFIIIPNYFIKLYRIHGPGFFRNFIFFTVTMLFFGFVLKYVSHDVAYLGTGRYRGIMGNPNGLGIYCFLVFILFFIFNDFYPTLFSKFEKYVFYGAILFSIYMTGSRNAVLAILLFYFFQKFFSFSPFLGFFVFLLTLFASEVISNNFTTIILSLGLGDFFRVRTLSEGSGRYIAWEFAWKQIQHNFFIGEGFAYNEYYMRQNYTMLQKMGHQGGIHNSFLTFWFDQGLVGLLIYLRSYILIFIKGSKRTKFAFPVLFAVSFTAMFESWLVGSLSAYSFFAICIFTIMVSEEIKKEDLVEEENKESELITSNPLLQ